MATQEQIESADTARYKNRPQPRTTNNGLRSGSTFTDRSIVPDSLAACAIDPARIPDMRRKIKANATDPDDQAMLLSMILGEG